MVVFKPVVMAPPRSTAPPRAFIASWNAQKLRSTRLRGLGEANRVAPRPAGVRQARESRASRELRDAFDRLDVNGTPPSLASPPRSPTRALRPDPPNRGLFWFF